MNYLIVDTTCNTGEIFIDTDGENSKLEENAMVFKTDFQANEFINKNGWSEWAKTHETSCPVNV